MKLYQSSINYAVDNKVTVISCPLSITILDI